MLPSPAAAVLLCQPVDGAFIPFPLSPLVSQPHTSLRILFILHLFPGKTFPDIQELGYIPTICHTVF